MTKFWKWFLPAVCAIALLEVGAPLFARANPANPSPAYVKQGPALCVNPSAYDGGLTAQYCLQPGTSAGNLTVTENLSAGATGVFDTSVLTNQKLGPGVVPNFDNLNGTAPTSAGNPLTCERIQYVIASNTVAAHDGGFVHTYAAAPVVIAVVNDTSDGGAWVGAAGAAFNVSTTGLTATSSANVSGTFGLTVCGN